ncbi:MAG: hypothetical protein ACE5GW_05590 [Planctomycetota bacterium]
MVKKVMTVPLLALVLLASAGPSSLAQEEAASGGQAELERRIRQLEDAHEELLDDFEELEVRSISGPAAGGPSLFNPRITVFGNMVGRVDDKDVFNEDGDPIDDRFNLREVEIDLRAAIDPWADGVMIIAVESEVPEEFDTAIEEGYLLLKRLPVIDSAPFGLKLKAGRFRAAFGRWNAIHTHDMPQTTRPLSLRTVLGEEGFVDNGLSAALALPTPGEANSLDLTLEALGGGNLPVAPGNAGEDPALLGHLKWFWDLAPGHDLEIGASGYGGRSDAAGTLDARLYGADITYKWKPFGGGEWRSFLVGGELFYADLERSGFSSGSPLGGYLWSQLQFSKSLYLGVRADLAQELDDDSLETSAFGVFASYYTTEFLRFRLGYERFESDVAARDGLDTILFEINFVFGSHPVEPYWVNR